ncbi:hypothetical protein GCM10009742_58880 [Kribbella karoonensis]|uniref:Uncharacterized protein n=1 Tax=Kribbella karoonensis TaxID=324851 RepID=A0ABN2EEK7_9ACTN
MATRSDDFVTYEDYVRRYLPGDAGSLAEVDEHDLSSSAPIDPEINLRLSQLTSQS